MNWRKLEQSSEKIESSAMGNAENDLIDIQVGRSLDQFREKAHHALRSLAPVPFHRRKLYCQKVIEVL